MIDRTGTSPRALARLALAPLIFGAALLFGLAACDSPASRPARTHDAALDVLAAPAETGTRTAAAAAPEARPQAANDNARRIGDRPIWTSTRDLTAEENARRHFERNGEAFGARTLDEFLARVHAFTGDPPSRALRLERANGDRLFYDPEDNVFAVVDRRGAPRTMFRPDDGMAYWERQKVREAEFVARNPGRRRAAAAG